MRQSFSLAARQIRFTLVDPAQGIRAGTNSLLIFCPFVWRNTEMPHPWGTPGMFPRGVFGHSEHRILADRGRPFFAKSEYSPRINRCEGIWEELSGKFKSSRCPNIQSSGRFCLFQRDQLRDGNLHAHYPAMAFQDLLEVQVQKLIQLCRRMQRQIFTRIDIHLHIVILLAG